MRPGGSHTLAPLTRCPYIKWKFQWTQVKQYVFDGITRIVARNTFLTYPDFNETFKIRASGSALRLGAVIIQKGKPIAFYIRKLTDSQQKYTVIEREILNTVETLKEFRTILLRKKLGIYTDHKNLTYKNFITDGVLRWRLILEEYGIDIEYIKGEINSSRCNIKDTLKW